MSNLRQIGMAMLMYAQDNDGILPLWERGGSRSSSTWRTWRADIYPYLKNEKVFICPSAPNRVAELRPSDFIGKPPHDYPSGYGVSVFFTWKPDGILLSRIWRVAHKCIMVSENYGMPCAMPWVDFPPAEEAIPNAHLGGSNYLFYDGHVEWLLNPVPRPLKQDPWNPFYW